VSTARTITDSRETNRGSRGAASPSPAGRPDDVHTTAAMREALLRVESEYGEMPGLSLTLAQAARLWGLDRGSCAILLTDLVERRVLKRAPNGTYLRR